MKGCKKVKEIGIIASIDLSKIKMMLEGRKRRRKSSGMFIDKKFCISIRDGEP
jgi:hypothetical protein